LFSGQRIRRKQAVAVVDAGHLRDPLLDELMKKAVVDI
jgi:hypothetical protein